MRPVALATSTSTPSTGVALSLRLGNEVEVFGYYQVNGVAALLSEL
jgi:hypothetical protein